MEKRDGLKQAAVSGVRYTGLANIITIAFSFLNTVVLARLLGPEVFGLFAMVSVYTGFALVISGMGMSEALIQHRNPTQESLASLYCLNVILGTLIYGISVISAPWVAAGFGAPELAELIPIGALTIPIGTLGAQYGVLARKELRFGFIAIVNVATSAITLGVTLVAAVGFDQGVWSFIWGALAGASLMTISNVVYGLKAFGFPGFRLAWRDLDGYLSFGIYRVGAMTLNYGNVKVDQILVGALFGPQVLGYYHMAINLVNQPLYRLNPMITQVAFSVFSKIQEDTPRLKAGFLKIVRLLSLLNAPIFIGFALVAPMAVPLILGDQWLPSVPLIQVLVFRGLIRVIPNAAGSVIMAKGKANWTFFWNLAGLAIIPLTIYLASRTGDVLTVAWALFWLQGFLLGIHYRVFLRTLLGGFLSDYIKAFGLPFLMAFGMAACVLGVREMLPEGIPVANLGIEVITGAAAYFCLIWVFLRGDVTEALRLAVGRK